MTINQLSKRTKNRSWAALLPVFLLAPLAMAPKGCEPVVIGDDCPDPEKCAQGTAGGDPGTSAGAAGKPTGEAGKPNGAGGKPNGSAGAGGGSSQNECGGLLGLECAANEYCAFDLKAACGAADQTGVCTPKPQVCTDIYAPVCGCDGQTYPSDCNAAAKGVSVASTGVCQEPSSGTTCGGLKPVACAKSEYCNYPIETKCGSGDQTGTCTKIQTVCDAIYDPVCGCDNVTYGSACTAGQKGISVLHTGACEATGAVCGGLKGTGCSDGQFCNFPIESKCGAADQTGTCSPYLVKCDTALDPVCGCDGKTYDNGCIAASAQVSVASKGACSPQPTTCGGKLGGTCASDQYCNYPASAICGKADATGTCTAKGQGACITLYDPVCGCDGKTYGNSCEAGLAGVSIASSGECS